MAVPISAIRQGKKSFQ